MNGEVYSVNTLEKISWERFKQLPTGLKEEYLRAIMDRFGVGMANISRDLFGCESACLYQHCKRYGVRVNATKGGKIAKSTLDRWRSWIDSDLDIVPNPSDAPVSETAEDSVEEVKPFRAHDYEDMLRECDLSKKDDEISEKLNKLMANTTGLYPLQDMSLTLEGKPVDVLAALQTSWPWLLDQNKIYRFSIKVDTFFLNHGDRTL